MITELRMWLVGFCLQLALRLAPKNDEGALLARHLFSYGIENANMVLKKIIHGTR